MISAVAIKTTKTLAIITTGVEIGSTESPATQNRKQYHYNIM